jgi:aerobic carbon-monoxide dehydrogenase medium subunit
MNSFQLHQPKDLASAAALMSQSADARFLAGGQSILASMKLGLASPDAMVDLSLIPDLKAISVSAGIVKIGAMVKHADVAANAEVKKAIPALAELAGGIGDRQVRNMGTIGGSLANSDPAACYPAAVIGLGATIHTNTRSIAADSFFLGLYETALDAGEIITAVSFPVPEKAAYVKFKNSASRFALVGVFVSKGSQGVRVAVTGAASCAFRATDVETALAASWTAAACNAVKMTRSNLNSDLHASAEYRAHLIPVIAGRAVTAAK